VHGAVHAAVLRRPASVSRAAGLDWSSLVSLRTLLRYWLTLIEGAVWYAIAGGLIGLLIWKMAYRPAGSERPVG
jgi:hypothetical protein